MANLKEDDNAMREILINAKVIAVVGKSGFGMTGCVMIFSS